MKKAIKLFLVTCLIFILSIGCTKDNSDEIIGQENELIEIEEVKLVKEPVIINIYQDGNITSISKDDNRELFIKILEVIEDSFEDEANPMRFDDVADFINNIKSAGSGIELIYEDYTTSEYPSFNESILEKKYKTLFIPLNTNEAILVFEEENGYSTAPIYLKQENEINTILD